MTPGSVLSSPVDGRGADFLPRFEDRGGGIGASSTIGSFFMLESGRAFLDEATGFLGIVRMGVVKLVDGGVEEGFSVRKETAAGAALGMFRPSGGGGEVGGSMNS